MPQISLSEEAQADADSAIDWYIGEGVYIAADDFINEIERALGLLRQSTPRWAKVAHTRHGRFPFMVSPIP